MVKTCSVSTAPDSSVPSSSAPSVMIGDQRVAQRVLAAPRRARAGPWRARCARSRLCSTCSIALRVWRISTAAMRVAEHEGRHDHRRQVGRQVLERADVARGRQPAELHREQQDHQDAEPEVRRRQAPQREHVGGVVPRPCRCSTAETMPAGMPISSAISIAMQRELRASPAASAAISSSTGCWLRIDSPRSPVQHAADPVAVVHRQRLVEVELLAQVAR